MPRRVGDASAIHTRAAARASAPPSLRSTHEVFLSPETRHSEWHLSGIHNALENPSAAPPPSATRAPGGDRSANPAQSAIRNWTSSASPQRGSGGSSSNNEAKSCRSPDQTVPRETEDRRSPLAALETNVRSGGQRATRRAHHRKCRRPPDDARRATAGTTSSNSLLRGPKCEAACALFVRSA